MKEEHTKSELENQLEYQRDIGLMYISYQKCLNKARQCMDDGYNRDASNNFRNAENALRYYEMMRKDYIEKYQEEP